MTIEIAITSNYAGSTGDPQGPLERIVEAGFSHVLWAHHAWSDYFYTSAEIEPPKRRGFRVPGHECHRM